MEHSNRKSLLLKILLEESFLTTLSRSGLHINGNDNRKDFASYLVVKYHFDLIEDCNFFLHLGIFRKLK